MPSCKHFSYPNSASAQNPWPKKWHISYPRPCNIPQNESPLVVGCHVLFAIQFGSMNYLLNLLTFSRLVRCDGLLPYCTLTTSGIIQQTPLTAFPDILVGWPSTIPASDSPGLSDPQKVARSTMHRATIHRVDSAGSLVRVVRKVRRQTFARREWIVPFVLLCMWARSVRQVWAIEGLVLVRLICSHTLESIDLEGRQRPRWLLLDDWSRRMFARCVIFLNRIAVEVLWKDLAPSAPCFQLLSKSGTHSIQERISATRTHICELPISLYSIYHL